MTMEKIPPENQNEAGKALSAKEHFLLNIEQMKSNAVLMRQVRGTRMEVIYVSEEFARMMECKREEAAEMMDGMGFLKTTHPEDRPFVRSMLKRRVGDDGTASLTIQKFTAKRKKIWCKVHYAFIEDFDEHYLYCTYTDITGLKDYEERLRSIYVNLGNRFYQENERTLSQLRVNLTRNRIEESKGTDLTGEELSYYPYTEILKNKLLYLPLSREREEFGRIMDRKNLTDSFLHGTGVVSGIFYMRRKNGRYCFAEVSATVTKHPISGDLVAFITEEEANGKKVQSMLMSTILAQQFDMVAYLSEGRYGVTIGDASRIKGGNLFPRKRRGTYQKYLEEQVRPVLFGDEDYPERMMEALSLERISEETKKGPYIVDIAVKVAGEMHHKRFDFYAVDPEADFYVVLKSDTTEMTRTQAEMNERLRIALAEAEQANVAKTAFLSSMSHEIRTPMNAIIGVDNIALRDPELKDKTREQFEKIGASARHLLTLINDILDMSRIESGRMVLKNEEFSLRSFLMQINTMVSAQCQEKGLTYDCRISPDLPEYFIGDDTKLKQVIINILGNSVKFTEPGGRVSFLVQKKAEYGDNTTLTFVMKDSGIGMDRSYLPRIFDAFSQEDATTTNRYGGSGLGMAITKNIVEMMNGQIEVDSEKGEGTEFTVTMPLRRSSRTDEKSLTAVRPQDMQVLIIDDDAIDCEHAKAVLEEVGIQSETAFSCDEALEMIRLRQARNHPYNLILMDLRMPGKDGIETTREIRELYNGAAAIVILTAYSWLDVEEEALSAGVDSFMMKPLFATNVVAEFQQALARKELSREAEKQQLADLKGRRILLAEDVAINAEIILMVLQMNGMQGEHAENGQIALDMFESHPEGYYDAILMDMRMPVMDGLSAARRIRSSGHSDGKTIPIIALTANAFDEDVQRSLQAGLNAHLSKPVEPEDLTGTLARLIRP